MQVHFLSAKVPLTKTFTRLPSGAIDKSAYPLVKNFTSHDEEIHTPEEFCAAVIAHAARGHSLLKGKLNRVLKHESRAGSTNPLDPTRWSCFDLDNVKGVTTVEAFVTTILPPQFHDVDYVLQYSASAGVIPDEGLRAHVYFIHERDFTPEAAKLWLTEVNLKHEALSHQVELTAAGTALRFPLDRTVCQNDKLIYIAPPALGDGVEDRLGDGARIQLVSKGRRYVDFDWATADPPAAVEALVQSKVGALRKTLGLKPKTGTTRQMKSGELLLKNPDTAVVTGEKKGRGFVYLNINGGDSWGYYYSEENPKYLRNFKGEPIVVLADFLPTYWSQIAGTLKKEHKGVMPFAFRHRPTDQTYNGVYDRDSDTIIGLAPTSRASLPDFFAQYDVDAPPVEDWTLEFRPSENKLIDFDARFCNLFERSKYMREPGEATEVVPPTIDKVLRHVVAGDQECYDHLLNWIATIFQHRIKTKTAWVLHGVEGTGKGVLYHKILLPIFGAQYCVMKGLQGMEERYNADLERCLMFVLDEGRIEDAREARKLINKFKNWITEPTMEIRGMRANGYQAPSFANFLITSNDYDAWNISPTDRRFNVAPRQERPLTDTLPREDIDKIPDELQAFAGFLAAYKADTIKAQDALMNDAKREMREASQDSLEQLAQAVTDGNLGYFMSFMDSAAASVTNLVAWSAYRAVLRRWIEHIGVEYVVRRHDLQDAYMYLMNPGTEPGPQKFSRMMAHKNVLLKNLYRCPATGEVTRGFKTKWVAEEEEVQTWKKILDQKVGASAAPPSATAPVRAA
jgi:hypothetical protein